MLRKKILIIGAGELQIPLILAAKKLGLTVIASDKNPLAKGFEYSDFHFIADTMDPQENIDQLKKFIQTNGNIHAVATSGTDASFTVASIAHELKLPGHHPQAALNASDKSLMRQCFEQAGVPIPQYKIVTNIEEARDFFEILGQPCVLKPIQNMGARGVSLITNIEELDQAFSLAKEYNKTLDKILIEEYIDAHELSIDALINNGVITITGIADRIIEYTPYFVETGHILPSSLHHEWLERAILTFRDGIKALKLTHGAAKADLKISKDKTWIIEIAARLSGGFMSSHTFPLSTGIPLQEYMVKTALGENLPEITPTSNHICVERAIITTPGKITNIEIPENILQQEYIAHVSVRAQIGDIVVSPKNNLDKIGNIIAVAPTRELALRAINKSIQSIKITIENLNDNKVILDHSSVKARELLKDICIVCKSCDGFWCRGKIPGVGGVGTGEGFTQAYSRFRQIKLIPNYIHEVRTVDTSITLFNQQLSMPILTAPIGGGSINYNNSISELELQRSFVKGSLNAGTLALVADPASPDLYPKIAQTILENYGQAISICKPRSVLEDIKLRYKLAVEAGASGLGTDIDGVGLNTFSSIGQRTSPKSIEELKELRSLYNLPFIIKGVLSVMDARKALEIGATHIIVSSHGGRIGESFPLPIDVLPQIKEVIGDRAILMVDGAIRSGSDVLKALLLGADAVLIGRPIAIHAVGGGHEAVTAYLQEIQKQLQIQMLLLGISNLSEIKNHPELVLDQAKLQYK